VDTFTQSEDVAEMCLAQTPKSSCTIKVTRIKQRWHARLYVNGCVRDEMACSTRMDIGWICREMLRWYDKSSGDSVYAHKARTRQRRGPYDKIWYQNALARKMKHKAYVEDE
jgi:hypothetical protein